MIVRANDSCRIMKKINRCVILYFNIQYFYKNIWIIRRYIKPISYCFELINKQSSQGTIKIDHDTLIGATDKTITDKRDIGNDGAKIEFRVILRGVEVSEGPSVTEPASVSPTTAETAASSPAAHLEKNVAKAEPTIKVTVVSGHGFKVEKGSRLRPLKKDVPDCYCVIRYGSSPEAWRTKTIKGE